MTAPEPMDDVGRGAEGVSLPCGRSFNDRERKWIEGGKSWNLPLSLQCHIILTQCHRGRKS